MLKITTNNIEISVETKYFWQQSIPKENHYFFVYFITITNKSDLAVQLLKRHWHIFDSGDTVRFVDGDGVVGETPIIEPNQKYTYNSGCNLVSEIGYMKGYYEMQHVITNKTFRVQIPQFDLVVPGKLN
jgi:ApaG protein